MHKRNSSLLSRSEAVEFVELMSSSVPGSRRVHALLRWGCQQRDSLLGSESRFSLLDFTQLGQQRCSLVIGTDGVPKLRCQLIAEDLEVPVCPGVLRSVCARKRRKRRKGRSLGRPVLGLWTLRQETPGNAWDSEAWGAKNCRGTEAEERRRFLELLEVTLCSWCTRI